MSNTVVRVVGKEGVEAELAAWQYKGHEPIDNLRLLQYVSGQFNVGVMSYDDLETVLVAEDKTYDTCQAAFAAMGARFDAMLKGAK